jgi:hypothetical protein
MDNKPTEKLKPINESVGTKLEARSADIKLAISYAIVLGIGIASGWYLTVSGFFG